MSNDRSGYRNGILRYPVSVVDHKKQSNDSLQEDVEVLKEWMEKETTQVSFWIGGGTTASDIMDNEHKVDTDANMEKSIVVTCNDNDNIILVIKDSFRSNFVRADMNGIEIPFVESAITVDDVSYDVFISANTYQSGTYTININQ